MILSTAYLPSISWYKAYLSEPCQIEIYESFPKQTLRNRCQIAGANGVQTLSVPVEKCEHKQLTKDVKIAYQQKWQHQHWQAIVSAYKNTPFFDYYEDFFRPIYEKQIKYLIDFNEQLLKVVNQLIQPHLEKPINYTTDWKGIIQEPIAEGQKEYYQIFADKQGFQPNLSIVDLLFNMGNETILYL